MDQPTNNDEAKAALRRFAYRIAGPREAVINVLINGSLAWWFFGGRSATPLTGPGSIFAMLLPMCFFLCSLTTFFGLLAGRSHGQRLRPAQKAGLQRWCVSAGAGSFLMGLLGLGTAFAAQAVLQRLFPETVLSPGQVITAISLVAGTLAFVLHTRAVLAPGSV